MQGVMVTGRMTPQKKAAGNAVLENLGLNPSQAINMLYSKLIDEKSASFLGDESATDEARWKAAATFVDSLTYEKSSRFDNMTDSEIKMDRLRSKGLV